MPCAAGVLIAGDDFKSGQTKIKSVLVDFLVGAGIKPTAIVSYNHLGNNDGMNLSAPQTFRSKEISKSNVVCAPPGAAHARARAGGRGEGDWSFRCFLEQRAGPARAYFGWRDARCRSVEVDAHECVKGAC